MEDRNKTIEPPLGFTNYDFNKNFKLMMFCLEFTRNEMSGEPNEYAKKLCQEWGYKNPREVYDLLWGGFKYYKGESFNKEFKIIESKINCNYCKMSNKFAEIKPIELL